MIRRPLTEITLKIDDLQECEAFRREQANSLMTSDIQDDLPKSSSVGPKATEEIHNRIGYVPKKKSGGPSTV